MEKSNFIPKVAIKGHYEFIEDDLSLLIIQNGRCRRNQMECF